MLDTLKARIYQGKQFIKDIENAQMREQFRGFPVLKNGIDTSACEGVCPTNAASVAKPFEGTIEISQEDCQSCGTCVDVCPCDALAFLVTSAPGQKLDPMSVKDQYCIRCGACAKSCPNGAITVTRTAVNNTPTKSATWIEALDALKN